jgi:parallel beta-helix repeat protein
MAKHRSILRIVYLTILITWLLALCPIPAMAGTITVCPSGCNYTGVQEAINAASPGDTIEVMAGTYPEAIEVNKTLTITGVNGTPVIGNPGSDASVLVSADGVTLENLKIATGAQWDVRITGNSSILRSLDMTGHDPGEETDPVVFADEISSVTIEGSVLDTTGLRGISVVNSSGITVRNCIIDIKGSAENAASLGFFAQCSGAHYSGVIVSNTTITGGGIDVSAKNSTVDSISVSRNTITSPGSSGITILGPVHDAPYSMTGVAVTGNTVTDNRGGVENIGINNCAGGIIEDNTIADSYNGADGMDLEYLDLFKIRDNTVKDSNVNPIAGMAGFNIVQVTNSVVTGNIATDVNPYSWRYAPGPVFLPNLTMDATNTAEGKPVHYYEDESGIAIDEDSAMVVLMSCRDMQVTGSTIASTGLGIGVYNCSGVSIAQNSLSETNTGLMLINSKDSLVSGNTFSGSFMGIGVGDNENALISGNSISEYADSGMVIHTGNSENVTITGNTFSGTLAGPDQGIAASDMLGNGITVVNNTFTGNSRGMLLSFASFLTIQGNNFADNGLGLNLLASSENIFANNTIQSTGEDYMGVFIYNNFSIGSGECHDNLFTNNYIEAPIPLTITAVGESVPVVPREYGPIWGPELSVMLPPPGDGSDNPPNIWNVTKMSGPNIVNGPFIGGNYWAKPDGTGWSQITPDRGDGFCNAPFVYDVNNTDYLPLHLYEGEIPITAPAVIEHPGHYRLVNDLANSSADVAIWIKASDVVLNGDGHTLEGILDWNSSGVMAGNMAGDLANVCIRNLTVTGWAGGTVVKGVTGSMLQDIRASGNRNGLVIDGSPGTMVKNCTVSDNIPLEDQGIFMGGTGINIDDSPGSCILDSTSSHNGWGKELPYVGGYGILSLNNTGLLVSGCTIDTNVNTGIWNEQSVDMAVTGSRFRDNTGNGGIFMADPQEDAVMNCTIADNLISGSGWGIWILRNDYTVRNNTVTGCNYGILLDSGRNATLSGNVMYDNEMNFGVDGTEIENYFHQVDTSNTVDGKLIYYLVETRDAVIDGASRAGTVYGIACSNLTVQDVTCRKNEYGLFLLASEGVTARNMSATNNQNGFGIVKSENVNIATCSARENSQNGYGITESRDVRVTRSDALGNNGGNAGTGIAVQDSRDIDLRQVNASLNLFAGVDLEGTSIASLDGVTADSNGAVGMILGGDSIQVTGCHIENNGGPGIGMLNSTNVTVWNNYFSNDLNVDLSQGVLTGSSWNVEKTPGTNIVGGPFFGGNYWANPDGTGFSQTHPDRGDGFCNAPYAIDADNSDYLPLHIQVIPPFYADFTGTPLSGNAPLTVQFADMSSGEPFRWYYRFGDGYTSTSQNPVHTYRTPGTYTVSLSIIKIENMKVFSTSTEKIGYVTVKGTPGGELVANFTAMPTTGDAPLAVSFTDTSTGNPTGFRYSFGDLFVSTSPNPVHTYRRPGTYSVQMTVWKIAGGKLQSNTTLCRDCITVT